ncbi:MAG: hypothetical protein RIB59_15850 [Rhodospirillales bacterium]
MSKFLTLVAAGLFALGLAAPALAECAGKPHTASAPSAVETASTQTPAPEQGK